MLRVNSPKDMPQGLHYAVIIYETHSYVTDDGWEGNNHTEVINAAEHYVTTDKEEWLKEVKLLADTKKENYVAFEVSKVAKVVRQIIIDDGEPYDDAKDFGQQA